jgi:hypothetical protein
MEKKQMAGATTSCEGGGVVLPFKRVRPQPCGFSSPSLPTPDDAGDNHTVDAPHAGRGKEMEDFSSQDKNADERACEESQRSWDAMLEGLQEYIERQAPQAA